MMNNIIQIKSRKQQALTLGHVLHVGRVVENLGEPLQQHGRLVVAVGDVLRLLEHLIQRRRLDLNTPTGFNGQGFHT